MLVLISVLFIALFTSCGLFNYLFQPYVGEWENQGVGNDQANYKVKAIFTKDSLELVTYKNGVISGDSTAKIKFSITPQEGGYYMNGNVVESWDSNNNRWKPTNDAFTAKMYIKGTNKDQLYLSVISNGDWADVIKIFSNGAFEYLKRK